MAVGSRPRTPEQQLFRSQTTAFSMIRAFRPSQGVAASAFLVILYHRQTSNPIARFGTPYTISPPPRGSGLSISLVWHMTEVRASLPGPSIAALRQSHFHFAYLSSGTLSSPGRYTSPSEVGRSFPRSRRPHSFLGVLGTASP